MKEKNLIESNSRKAIKYRGPECLNCGHPLDLSDVYCSYCSQLNSTKQLSLKDFLGEFLTSIVTYDSRLRYTINDLLFKPGVITQNYVNGQRLKYANPFRFFLSISIIFFLLQGVINTFFPSEDNNFTTQKENTNGPISFSFSDNKKDENTKDTAVLIAKDSLGVVGDSIKNETKKDSTAAFEYISEKNLDTLSFFESTLKRFELYQNFYEKHKVKNPSIALDSLHHQKTFYNKWMYSKNNTIEKIKENPSDFVNYISTKVPFFLFFFAPFFALSFWIIYSKQKHSYIEHMVFLFHIFSFLFLTLLLSIIPDSLIGTDVFAGIIFGLIAPFYFYKALRNFYKQSRVKTIIKFVFLNIVFGISATFAALLFFAVTAAIY